MRNKNRRWLFVWAVASYMLHIVRCELVEADVVNNTKNENSEIPKELRSVFSPRMDYEQWTPLGRGDPLKNDPTYDYLPPVLDRVHYWIDPSKRKPDGEKSEILVLGVSSKKPSTTATTKVSIKADSRRDIYDPFVKFVDGPKFQSNYQRISRPHYPIPYSYYPSPFYKTKNDARVSFSSDQRIPYTMLMPPPVPTSKPTFEKDSTSSSTQTSVTIQEGNLVYQSSTSEDNKGEWKDDKNYYTVADSSLVTWRTPLPYHEYMKDKNESKDDDHKGEMSFDLTLNSDEVQISGPDIMYKGQVSDGDLDVASTYVNIGKPEAQVHSVSGASALSVEPPVLAPKLNLQTMQPPPLSPTNTPTITQLLQNEITPAMMSTFLANIPKATTKVYTTTTPTPSTTTHNSLTTDPLFRHYKQPSEPLRGPMYLIIQGHSKVKTYGPSKQIHGINIQEINEIPINDYKDEFQVKHLHTYKKKEEERARIGRSKNFENLSQVVQTGVGAIDFASRRHDIQETELKAGYDVRRDGASEVYHKGIVEDLARKLKEA